MENITDLMYYRVTTGDLVYHPMHQICRIVKADGMLRTISFLALEKQNLILKTAEVSCKELTPIKGNLLMKPTDFPIDPTLNNNSTTATQSDPINAPNTSFDELPFNEVKKLYIEKIKATQANDTRKLTKLLEQYPGLFCQETFAYLETVFKMARGVIYKTECAKKIIPLARYRKKDK